MLKNDILRRLRYTLNLSNSDMVKIFNLAKLDITEAEILILLKKEDEDDFIECTDKELELFLDGLIILKRGPKDSGEQNTPVYTSERISNNAILKKLRIALNFKEEDMLNTFQLAEFPITKGELSALFRKRGNKNYKVCGDQIVRNFLQGLTVHFKKND